MKIAKTLALCALSAIATAQSIPTPKKVLFIGNSYTYRANSDHNNLLTKYFREIARLAGDELISEVSAIPSHSLSLHYDDSKTTKKIASETWDYVSIQEKMDLLDSEDPEVDEEVLQPMRNLIARIKKTSPQSKTILYMTFAEKNENNRIAYETKDNRIARNTMRLADSTHSQISPVGEVFRTIRLEDIRHFSSTPIELYAGDKKHPSIAGSFAAAVTFYTVIFRKNPTTITYRPAGVTAAQAARIKSVVKDVVFDDFAEWNIEQPTLTVEGLKEVCKNNAQEGSYQTYKIVNPVNGASYIWSVTGAILQSGQGTATTTYQFNPQATQVTIEVTESTSGITTILPVKVLVRPVINSITGPSVNKTICYHQQNVPYQANGTGTSYKWKIPSDAIISSGAGTAAVQISFGRNSGQVEAFSVTGESCQSYNATSTWVNIAPCNEAGIPTYDATVYPQPANQVLNIETPYAMRGIKIVSANTQATVLELSVRSNTVSVNVSSLPTGTYILQLNTLEGDYRKTISISR